MDVRDSLLDSNSIDRFLREFGDNLVNRRSATWRNLSDSERQGTPEDLIARHPSLMKRPAIVDGELVTLGWNAASRARHLGK